MLSFRNITGLSILLFFIALLGVLFAERSYIWLVFPWLFWLVITAIGSFHISWNYHLHAIHRSANKISRQVAITFDDGPDPTNTPKILDILKNHQATASFFCIGKRMQEHPEVLKRIQREGHTIGNHTYTHSRNMGFFGSQRISSELKRTNTVAQEILGKHLQWYRPAFGVTNPAIKKALEQTDLRAVGWSIRSYDTLPLSEAFLYKRITKRIQGGDIILLHDTGEKTVAVLERLLLFLQQNGWEAVSVDTLLKEETND